jgi:hypothetical protein
MSFKPVSGPQLMDVRFMAFVDISTLSEPSPLNCLSELCNSQFA